MNVRSLICGECPEVLVLSEGTGLTVQGCTVKAQLGMDASETFAVRRTKCRNVIAPTRPSPKCCLNT